MIHDSLDEIIRPRVDNSDSRGDKYTDWTVSWIEDPQWLGDVKIKSANVSALNVKHAISQAIKGSRDDPNHEYIVLDSFKVTKGHQISFTCTEYEINDLWNQVHEDEKIQKELNQVIVTWQCASLADLPFTTKTYFYKMYVKNENNILYDIVKREYFVQNSDNLITDSLAIYKYKLFARPSPVDVRHLMTSY